MDKLYLMYGWLMGVLLHCFNLLMCVFQICPGQDALCKPVSSGSLAALGDPEGACDPGCVFLFGFASAFGPPWQAFTRKRDVLRFLPHSKK